MFAGVQSNSFLHWTFRWNCNCSTWIKVNCVYDWGGDWIDKAVAAQAGGPEIRSAAPTWMAFEAVHVAMLGTAAVHLSMVLLSHLLVSVELKPHTPASLINDLSEKLRERFIEGNARWRPLASISTVTGLQTRTHTCMRIHTHSPPK